MSPNSYPVVEIRPISQIFAYPAYRDSTTTSKPSRTGGEAYTAAA